MAWIKNSKKIINQYINVIESILKNKTSNENILSYFILDHYNLIFF